MKFLTIIIIGFLLTILPSCAASKDTIDFFTFSTTGNAADFGDLTQARMNVGSSDAHGGLG